MNTQSIKCIQRSSRDKLGHFRPQKKKSRVFVSSAEVRIRASGGDRNQTVVEAQDIVEIDGGQDYEYSAMSITINEGIFEDDGDVDFGTQAAASIVADAVAEFSFQDDIAFLEEDSDWDDEGSKIVEDGKHQ